MRWLHSPWAAFGALAGFLALAFGIPLVMLALKRSESTQPETPVAVRGITAADVQDYSAQLKAKVPFDQKQFTAAGMKAVEYTSHEHYPNYFQTLTIRIEPVTLTDRVTGKSQTYRRARLTLCPLDPPEPAQVGGDLRGYGNRAYTSIMKIIQWSQVELLS